ncbi:hypothetical protein PGB90_002895 [Kerria lacca]
MYGLTLSWCNKTQSLVYRTHRTHASVMSECSVPNLQYTLFRGIPSSQLLERPRKQ